MKTQSEIEDLLSNWYGPEGVARVLAMDEVQLAAEIHWLLSCQPSRALYLAAGGVIALEEIAKAARPTVRINLTKRPVHA